MPPFQVQQVLLDIQPASITGQFAVGSDDPMAGNENGDRIFIVCHAHRPAGFFIADGTCNLLVGSCFTVRDLPQGFPYLLPEWRAFRFDGEIKGFSPAAEIFLQFLGTASPANVTLVTAVPFSAIPILPTGVS